MEQLDYASNYSAVRCVSDVYDRSADAPYTSVEDFLLMCDACFGERPALTWRRDGWYDSEDRQVLVSVVASE